MNDDYFKYFVGYLKHAVEHRASGYAPAVIDGLWFCLIELTDILSASDKGFSYSVFCYFRDGEKDIIIGTLTGDNDSMSRIRNEWGEEIALHIANTMVRKGAEFADYMKRQKEENKKMIEKIQELIETRKEYIISHKINELVDAFNAGNKPNSCQSYESDTDKLAGLLRECFFLSDKIVNAFHELYDEDALTRANALLSSKGRAEVYELKDALYSINGVLTRLMGWK